MMQAAVFFSRDRCAWYGTLRLRMNAPARFFWLRLLAASQALVRRYTLRRFFFVLRIVSEPIIDPGRGDHP